MCLLYSLYIIVHGVPLTSLPILNDARAVALSVRTHPRHIDVEQSHKLAKPHTTQDLRYLHTIVS